MSPPGRPKGESLVAQHGGNRVSRRRADTVRAVEAE